jgi:membrane-associated phospholipid phosphatase
LIKILTVLFFRDLLIKSTLTLFLLLSFHSHTAQDLRILKHLNQKEMPNWDKSMKIVSFSVFHMAPASVIGTWSYGYFNKDEPMMRNAYKSGIAICFSTLVSSGLKRLVDRPRPYLKHPDDIKQRDRPGGRFSFPSGHTTTAFAIATTLSLSHQKWYVLAPSFLYASFVGYTRLRLGMHYPSDVLAGILIGVGSGLLTWQVDRMVNGVK